MNWNPDNFGPRVADLLADQRLDALGPGTPNQRAHTQLTELTARNICDPHTVRDADMARGCLAGLWLFHDFLDESHTISQSISSATGSYWHGIMHRREPDFPNSKYWYRQVGEHDIFPALAAQAREIAQLAPGDESAEFLVGQTDWDPYRFVDLCEGVIRGRSNNEAICRQVAQAEWRCLFEYSFRCAIGE